MNFALRHRKSATYDDALYSYIYTSFEEAQEIANELDMTVVSERQGRDFVYKLCPKKSIEEAKQECKKIE